MHLPLTFPSICVAITTTALIGMIMGALFGAWAGHTAPDLFTHVFPWVPFEPVGVAKVLGAIAGVLCGGGMGAYGVADQVVIDRQQDHLPGL